MVFVKVRETYDLHTVQDKMTVIGIHTPKPDIIKKNFPGLLMQCKAYRPYSCDVRLACASVLPVDPLGVGLSPGEVAPEDLFNPILYKAITNKGMSQIEARISAITTNGSQAITVDVVGNAASVEVDDVTTATDEFPIYYGLLSNSHGFKHANPQSGLEMRGLKPLVFDVVANVGDQKQAFSSAGSYAYPSDSGSQGSESTWHILGKAKEFPFINCTSYSSGVQAAGFPTSEGVPGNHELDVPWLNAMVGVIIVPPSRLHELFYRMVVEWTIEFTSIRPIGEITDWTGLAGLGNATHFQNYSYSTAKEVVTGDSDTILKNDTCMVDANVEVNKVM